MDPSLHQLRVVVAVHDAGSYPSTDDAVSVLHGTLSHDRSGTSGLALITSGLP